MKQIITSEELLSQIASPLKFLSKEGADTAEGLTIIKEIKEVMEADKNIIALAAPQIGIDSRIFCIRFNDTIKTFVNPIVTKKANYIIRPETFISMPGKEILISRPEELTVVYYTDEFKYEENKLLGAAARIFDQHCQLLDGILPSELGLVSDVAKDGSLADCTEEEIKELSEFYKTYIQTKTQAMQAEVVKNLELEKQYKSLRFTENVINGRARVVADAISPKAQAVATLSMKKAEQVNKAINRAQMINAGKKGKKKYKGGKK